MNRGGIHIKKGQRGGVVKRDVDPYKSESGSSEEREEVESSEKDKPCLTKMMTLPLAFVGTGERIPDREWVRSKRRAENPGRGRGVKIGFLDTDKINKRGQKKVK